MTREEIQEAPLSSASEQPEGVMVDRPDVCPVPLVHTSGSECIELRRLHRFFGKTKAVNDISFTVDKGHVFGYIGPNGAGKTTSMRILATLDLPSYGDAFVDGFSVVNDPELVDLMRMATLEVAGPDSVQPIPRPSMGSEDFAFYMDYAPGAMIRLGCTSPEIGGSPLHAPDFDVDEEALRIGAKVLARAAVYWSEPRRGAKSESNPELANA